MNFSDDFSQTVPSALPLTAGVLIALGLVVFPSTRTLAQTASLAGECSEFAESVNRNQIIMASFEAEIATFAENASAAATLEDITAAAGQYVEAVDQVTDRLEELADELAVLPIADIQLRNYRDGYLVVLAGFDQALDTMNMAMSNVMTVGTEAELIASLEAVESDASTAIGQIESLAVDESNLIDNVNDHCGAE